jgi:hypothetical protein
VWRDDSSDAALNGRSRQYSEVAAVIMDESAVRHARAGSLNEKMQALNFAVRSLVIVNIVAAFAVPVILLALPNM